MRLTKRALPLAVTVSLVGSIFAITAPAAHGVTLPPDSCGTYLQGVPDPQGGVLPAGIIPLVPPSSNHVYGVAGHESKGQDKVVIDLNNTIAGAKRFAAGVVIGGAAPGNGPVAPFLQAALAPTPLSADATTTVKIGWKNDLNTGSTGLPTIAVVESENAGATKAAIAKGVTEGVPGADSIGAAIGNVQHGNTVVPQNEIDEVVIPAATTGGTYQLTMTFPPLSFGPTQLAPIVVTSAAIQYNASPASVQTTLQTAFTTATGGLLTGTPTVSGSALAPPANGVYDINFGGLLSQQSLPLLTIVDPQTGDLATERLDDGSIWQGKRFGGTDPGITGISDIGHGVWTDTGIMSSGPVGGTPPINGKNTGKAGFVPDTQFLHVNYPVALVAAAAPRLGTNDAGMLATLGVLAAITGLTVTQLNNDCSLGGLLALFCAADAAVIPATFAGLCGAILGP